MYVLIQELHQFTRIEAVLLAQINEELAIAFTGRADCEPHYQRDLYGMPDDPNDGGCILWRDYAGRRHLPG